MDCCYLCGSSKKEIIHHGVRDAENVNVLKCKECGLVYLDQFIYNVDEFYSQSCMRENEEKDISKIRDLAEVDDERRYDYIKEAIINKSYLDFGCGAGGVLNKVKGRTLHTHGVELEKRMCEVLNEEGFTCFASLEELEAKSEIQYDVITLFHVLEHLEDPIDTLSRLKALLKPNGRIIIEVPNADDALLSLYKCTSFADFTYWKCHLYLFNNFTLRKTIEKAGMTVHFMQQFQRYPLSNHLYWLSRKKAGGHIQWAMMNDKEMDTYYGDLLARLGIADTILVEAKA